MYSNTKEYATRDTYEEFSGIDLSKELKSSQYDNPSQAVEIFIKQQQTWLYEYMKTRYKEKDWELYWDDDTFSRALLWQIKHVLVNGEDDKLCIEAYRILRSHGMANRKWWLYGKRYKRTSQRARPLQIL